MACAILHAMRVSVDRSGRLVLPADLRRRLHLQGGGEVEVTEYDGVVEIRPVEVTVDLSWTDEGLPVFSSPGAEPLTQDVVRETLEAVREDRR